MNANIIENRLERAPVEAGVTVRLGLDVHAAQITVCRQVDGRLPQPAQQLSWPEVIALVRELLSRGATVLSCYEAVPCGYGLHRQLTAMGVTNYVVAPPRRSEGGQAVTLLQWMGGGAWCAALVGRWLLDVGSFGSPTSRVTRAVRRDAVSRGARVGSRGAWRHRSIFEWDSPQQIRAD